MAINPILYRGTDALLFMGTFDRRTVMAMATIAHFVRHTVRNLQAGFGGHAVMGAIEA